jgi:hypothetical protein
VEFCEDGLLLQPLVGNLLQRDGHDFPTMSLVQVVALVEDEARVEIEATAVMPK